MGTSAGAGNSSGLGWWAATMNGALYEESSPPIHQSASPFVIQQQQQQQQQTSSNQQQQQQQPTTPTSPAGASGNSTTGGGGAGAGAVAAPSGSSTSPSASSVASNSTAGPLHIPAKRPSTYGEISGEISVSCVDPPSGSSVIRHSHSSGGSQSGWSYSPHHPQDSHYAATPADSLNHHQTYGANPTYYTLADPTSTGSPRDPNNRKLPSSFWSPAAVTTGSTASTDYKSYNSISGSAATTASSTGGSSSGSAADPAVSCHQSFSQSAAARSGWYPPYHHHPVDTAAHHHSQYLTTSATDDRGRVPGMVTDFAHDSYTGLRTGYSSTEPVTSSPYPPPGKHQL